MMDEKTIVRTALYSARETSALLGVSPDTLLRRTKSGEIRARVDRHNGRRVYLGEEIIRYIRRACL